MWGQWQLILEFAFGGALLYFSIRSHLLLLSELLSKWFGQRGKRVPIAIMSIRLIIGIVGGHLILDPLIAGQATICVHSPKKFPTVLENLDVRTAPVKFDGTIDPARIIYKTFAENGKLTELVVFHILEQNIQVTLYDRTRPEPLQEQVIRLSPYARRGFWTKHIFF
jgi:hypothetical protein